MKTFKTSMFGYDKKEVDEYVKEKDEAFEALVQDSKDNGHAIDCTGGKKTRSVIVTDSGHVILSALQHETIVNRVPGAMNPIDDEPEGEEE